MAIDWLLVLTASAVIIPVVSGIVAYIANRLRTADLDYIKTLKHDSDIKIQTNIDRLNSLENRVADVYTNVQAKLDKTEHQLALARIDKEMESMRLDQKGDLNKIDGKLDRLIDMLIIKK